ncbi:ABC transporter ATP-binding protein [Dactylosporangium sp. NPDC051485]|uniref:ABC transporter ATP-binding protein n=1 Tax=Dactylosporangium sp. NPDC051485 TaxID=3154846 RepID=UPI0034226814
MRRYVTLWISLMRLSWRRHPALTGLALGSLLLDLATFAAVGLTLRAAVDSASSGAATAAVAGAAGLAVCYGITTLLGIVTHNVRAQVAERVSLLELDPEFVRLVNRIETIEHLERTDFLDRITVLRNGSGGIVDSAWGAVETVLGVCRLMVTLLLLGTVDPWLLMLLVFAVAPLWFDQRSSGPTSRAETAAAESVRLQRHLFTLATTASAGKEIRIAGAGAELIRRQRAAWDDAARVRFRAQCVAAAWRACGWIVYTAGFVAGLLLVVRRTAAGQGTPGDIALAITVAASLRIAVQQTLNRATGVVAYRRLLDPYLWLRDYAAEHTPAGEGAPAPDRLADGIVLDRLTFTYPGTDRPALRDVSVRIPAGTLVAVVGEYGSGKSTLVKLLCKFYQPDSGAIRVDGVDLRHIGTASWRRRISAAFQDFGRYETTLRDVVGLGDPHRLDDTEAIGRAVTDADLDAVVAGLPDGLDTPVGEQFGGVNLSEGQWQKTALARACLRDGPVLFVLDEPTASLDAPSEHAIFQRYMTRARQLAASTGAVTVIVSHRFSTVSGADMIMVLRDGALVEWGSHDSLLGADGLYANLYGIQATAYDASPRG